jgi:hypothetical protein
MIRISFHCCQNIISAWKWVFFSKKKKKNFGEKKCFWGRKKKKKKEENYAGEFEPEGCKARVSGRRRRRNIYKDIMQFFAFLMLWLESSRDNRRNSLFFFFSQNRKKKESKKDNIHVERRRGGERDRQIPKGEGYRRAVTARADALFRSSTRSNWLPKRPLLLLHPPTLFTRSYTSHPLYSVLVRRKRKKKPPSLSSLS